MNLTSDGVKKVNYFITHPFDGKPTVSSFLVSVLDEKESNTENQICLD